MQSSFSKHTNNNCHCIWIWYKTQFKEIKRGWASKGMTSTRWRFVPRPMTIILLGNNHFLIGRGGGWDFHCACNFFFWTFLSQNIFFSWRQQKIVFFSCGTKIHFSIKTIHWLLKFSSAIFFLSNWWQHNFFFSYNEKSTFLFSQLGH